MKKQIICKCSHKEARHTGENGECVSKCYNGKPCLCTMYRQDETCARCGHAEHKHSKTIRYCMITFPRGTMYCPCNEYVESDE